MSWYDYKPYVSVAQRRAQAAREVEKRLKKGQTITPIRIEGRTIARTFWGKAWCTNLEGYSDYANRIPRGRTYVRNGSVIDLKIEKGRIKALVSGSELYEIQIDIAALPTPHWTALKKQCAGQIGSLVELLQGKLSKGVMELVTDRGQGLFPKPKEITMRCSCPDYAGMCKHLAAVMYGVGNRLDSSPELLFLLRGVDHVELIEQAIPASPAKAKGNVPTIATDELGDIFGIEIGDTPVARDDAATREAAAPKKAAKKAPAKKRAAAATREAAASGKVAKKAPATRRASAATREAVSGKVAKKAPAVKKSSAAKGTSAVKKTKSTPARKKE
jgi:uncharacterized Zn finger protein